MKLYIADIRGHVIDGMITGHIINVAKNYREILSFNYDVKIAAGPAILNSFGKDECLVLPYNISSTTLIDKIHTFVNFIFLLYKGKSSPIIIQQSTTITTFLAVIFFYWWTSPLYMIQYNTDAVNTWWKKLINKFAQFKLSGTLCPTERIGKAYGGRYCVVPDFFYTEENVDSLSLLERKWDICIVGNIIKSKGVIEAARFLANSSFDVLIAGKICEDGLEQPLKKIVSSCKNIDLRLGFLSDKEYSMFMAESKFCMLNYHGTYFDRSSGVVLDALYNGTPVIGTRCEALKIVEENTLGILYDNINEIHMNWDQIYKNYDIYLDNIKLFLSKQSKYNKKILSFIK